MTAGNNIWSMSIVEQPDCAADSTINNSHICSEAVFHRHTNHSSGYTLERACVPSGSCNISGLQNRLPSLQIDNGALKRVLRQAIGGHSVDYTKAFDSYNEATTTQDHG